MIAMWASFIGYELVWFVAVIFAGRGEPWPGVIAALLFVGWQLGISPQRRVALQVLAIAVACGVVIDGLLSGLHLADYAGPRRRCRLAAHPCGFSGFGPVSR